MIIHWDFEIPTDHLILARLQDLEIINKKKRTCQILDFAVPADHRIKLKEIKKKEVKKVCKMKETGIQIVNGTHGTVSK